MGNCQNDTERQDYEFKRKQIFNKKCNKQNIPHSPVQLNPQNQHKIHRKSKPQLDQSNPKPFDVLSNKNINVPEYLENSLVKVEVSRGDPLKRGVSAEKLPEIVSDPIMSLGQISNLPEKVMQISIDKMVRKFQQEDTHEDTDKTRPNNNLNQEGVLNSNSWGRSTRQQIGIKYTNSYYLSEEDEFPSKD